MRRLVFVVVLFTASLAYAQRQASPEMERTAYMAISTDGWTVTFRAPAPDAQRVCVELGTVPEKGPYTCFTLGQIRRGELVLKPVR